MSKPAKGVSFYAVNRGRKTGVFLTWDECQEQVKGFPNPVFRKFTNAAEAEAFVESPAAVGHPPTKDTSHITTTPNAATKKRAVSPNDVDDESGWDVVYCDGACKGNGQSGSVAGVGVWWGHSDSRNIAERCPGDQTNNRAELIAILRILETTPLSTKPLLIKSDSQYSINCFKRWLPNWIRNNYHSASGAPVKNVGVIKYLAAHLDARARNGQKVRLQYVKGHSGEEGNEGADAQANLGALLPAVAERNWEKLEKEVKQRTEAQLKNSKQKHSVVPLEVDEHGDLPKAVEPTSPTKARKVEAPRIAERFPEPPKIAPQYTAAPPIVARGREPPQKVQHTMTAISADDIDLGMYEDCLLDDDELMHDLDD